MSDTWTQTTLGECCDFVVEKVDPASLAARTPYVGLEHIGAGNGRLIGSGTAQQVTSTVSKFSAADTLFGRLRPYLRKVAQAEVDGVCSPEVLVLRPRTDIIHPGYLYLVASSSQLIDHAVRLSAGSRMPRTSQADLAGFVMMLPPLDAQRRAIDLVASVDRLALALEEQIEATTLLGSAIAAGAWEQALSRETPGRLEQHCSRVKNGVMYKRDQGSGGIAITRIESVSTGTIDLTKVGFEGLNEQNAADFLLEAGDILFSHKNSLDRVGTTALVTEHHLPLLNGDNLLQIRARDRQDAQALFMFLRSRPLRQHLKTITKPAVNQASVNSKQVLGLPMPAQISNEDRRLADAYVACEALIDRLTSERSQLGHLRDKAISSLVVGELVLPDGYDAVFAGEAA